MADYKNKCGTCVYWDRDRDTKHGWCHKRKYSSDVACDPEHPYPVYEASRGKCRSYMYWERTLEGDPDGGGIEVERLTGKGAFSIGAVYAKLAEYEEAEERGELVRVTRCKDCLHLDMGENESESWCYCKWYSRDTSINDYCSAGKAQDFYGVE